MVKFAVPRKFSFCVMTLQCVTWVPPHKFYLKLFLYTYRAFFIYYLYQQMNARTHTHTHTHIYIYIYISLNQSHYRPEVPRGFQEVNIPRLRDNDPGQPYAPAAFYPQEILLVHIFVRGWVDTHTHIYIYFFSPPHVLCGLRGPPSWAWQKCNLLLKLGRPWGAVTLSRWCVWVVIEEDVVPGGSLNLNSTNLPRPWSPRKSSPLRKIPTVEPGNEPGTSWLVVRDSDH